MEHARPPPELNMEGGPVSRADAWKRWRQQFNLFVKASGVNSETSGVQASLLVNLIGPEGFDVFQTFTFNNGKEKIIVESDHKPLESIFKKPLMSVPARLQRMMLRLQHYDLIVQYKPGKYLYLADTLSRAPLPDLYSEEVHKNNVYQIEMMVNNLPISNDKLSLIKKETKRDSECCKLSEYINFGWPEHKSQVASDLKIYWSFREDFFIVDDVIFKKNLVLVPQTLRAEMLGIVHEGHLGIDRCKRRARQVMYWPNMTRDIEMFVRRCHTCQECSNAPAKEPLLPIEIPQLPWKKLGSDIFEFKKKYFLIIVDYYSNYVEVSHLPNISSNSVIVQTKEIFSRHGIPEIFITDNGTQYSSREFKTFASEWGFRHVTSSPNYAQANGKSERAVQTVKLLLKKAIISNGDFHLALLNYRNTPRDGLSSPAQLLMGRRLRCKLPVHPELLKPQPIDPSEYHKMLRNQIRAKEQYDKNCKQLSPLNVGDEVICIDGKARTRATVVDNATTPRSYIIQNKLGRRFRRNRRHLIKCEADESAEDVAPAASSGSGQRPSCPCPLGDEAARVGHSENFKSESNDENDTIDNDETATSEQPTRIIMTRSKAKQSNN